MLNVMRIIVAVAALLPWVVALGKTGRSVQPVADIPVNAQVWNLAECEPSGNEYDYTVEEGDSCTRVWSPVSRLDFTGRGDTVMQTCAEKRAYRTFFSPGLLQGMPGKAAGEVHFSLKGRVYQSQYVAGDGWSSVSEPVPGVLMTQMRDTIDNASLHRSRHTFRWFLTADSLAVADDAPDSLMCVTVVDEYRIMADGERFPRGFKRVSRTEFGGVTVDADSMAWVLSPEASDATDKARQRFARRTGQNGASQPGLSADNGEIAVNVRQDAVSVTGPEDLGATVVVTDMLGRRYIEKSVTLTATGNEIATAGLPRGEYLLQVIPADGSAPLAVKFAR